MSSQFAVKVLGYSIPLDYVLVIGIAAFFVIVFYKILGDSMRRDNI